MLRPRANPLRRARARLGLLVLPLISGSCFFELPPLVEGVAGAGGSSGMGGGPPPFQGGSAGSGGSGGSGTICLAGEKDCDGQCRPPTAEFGCSSSSCESCGSAPNAVTGCVSGSCAVVACNPGFVDCDGDALNGVGPIAGNGCEFELGVPAPSVASLDVPFASIQVDGKREDWNGLPAYTFEQVCSNCEDQYTELISADSTIPPPDDLDARFRVAWDANKFYLLFEAFDNQLFDAGVEGGRCQHQAECEDAVQVFFAGKEDRAHGYFNDNQRVFLGLSEQIGAPSQGQPDGTDVELRVERQGSRCYRIEAQVDWRYITSVDNGDATGHFPPAPGQSYGFDIAANDWDAPISDPAGIQRQSQIFWLDPGPNYGNAPDGIGTMTLVGGEAPQ